MILIPMESQLLDPSFPAAASGCPQHSTHQERPSSHESLFLAQCNPCSLALCQAATLLALSPWGGALKPTLVPSLQLPLQTPSAEVPDTGDALAGTRCPSQPRHRSRNVTHFSRQRSSGEQSCRHT